MKCIKMSSSVLVSLIKATHLFRYVENTSYNSLASVDSGPRSQHLTSMASMASIVSMDKDTEDFYAMFANDEQVTF